MTASRPDRTGGCVLQSRVWGGAERGRGGRTLITPVSCSSMSVSSMAVISSGYSKFFLYAKAMSKGSMVPGRRLSVQVSSLFTRSFSCWLSEMIAWYVPAMSLAWMALWSHPVPSVQRVKGGPPHRGRLDCRVR